MQPQRSCRSSMLRVSHAGPCIPCPAAGECGRRLPERTFGSFVMFATNDSCTHDARKNSSNTPATVTLHPLLCGGTAAAAGTIWNATRTASASTPLLPLRPLLLALPPLGGDTGRGMGASSESGTSGSSIMRTSYFSPGGWGLKSEEWNVGRWVWARQGQLLRGPTSHKFCATMVAALVTSGARCSSPLLHLGDGNQ